MHLELGIYFQIQTIQRLQDNSQAMRDIVEN